MAHGKASQIKEKIKNFLHHDKTQETTPDAAPGYVEADKATNVPEAFYPGAKPVNTLGQMGLEPTEPQPTAIPDDKVAMLGAPRLSKDSEAPAPSDESTPAAAGQQEQDAAPSSIDRGLDVSNEEPQQTTGEGGDVADESKELPTAGAETNEEPGQTTAEESETGAAPPAEAEDNPTATPEEPAEESRDVPTTDAETTGEPEETTSEGENVAAPPAQDSAKVFPVNDPEGGEPEQTTGEGEGVGALPAEEATDSPTTDAETSGEPEQTTGEGENVEAPQEPAVESKEGFADSKDSSSDAATEEKPEQQSEPATEEFADSKDSFTDEKPEQKSESATEESADSSSQQTTPQE